MRAIIAFLALSAAACGTDITAPMCTGTPDLQLISGGELAKNGAVVLEFRGSCDSEREIVWSSSDSSVVDIQVLTDSTALVLGRDFGTATVTAAVADAASYKASLTFVITEEMSPT